MVDSNQEKVDVEIGCEKCCPRYKNSPRDEKAVRLLQNRLNRMIGQLNGIKNMVEGNRYCGDILTQVAAVESAFMLVKPPMPKGLMQLSAPPQTMAVS